jgi:hypothetical protein
MKKLFLSSLLCTTFTGVNLKQATDWLDFAEQQMRGKSSIGKYSMLIKTENWERSLEIDASVEGQNKALIFITDPAKEKGVATLRLDNNLWNYFPKLKKKIIVAPSMLLSSWMGSDFTNDDVLKASSLFEDYDHKFLTIKNPKYNQFVAIENMVKSNTKAIWPKIVSYHSKEDCLPRVQQYFDKSGKLKRAMIFSKVKKFGNNLLPSVWTIQPADDKKKSTTIIYKQLKFNVKFPEGHFTERKLTGN